MRKVGLIILVGFGIIMGLAWLSEEGNFSDLRLSVGGEPPTVAEVKNRSEALTNRGAVAALRAMLCPAAQETTTEWLQTMESEYPEFIGFDDIRPGAAVFDGLEDTTKAEKPLDDYERMIRSLERDC